MHTSTPSPTRHGMERQGTHLYSLPSALRKKDSASTIGSTNTSRMSQSPDVRSVPLTSSSRSSLGEMSPQENRSSGGQHWALLSIERISTSSGMVLVALYHLPTQTLYTWPLQTDPKAPQPRQGTVFVAPRHGKSGEGKEAVTSESLQVLTKVLLTWMRAGASRSNVKAKLGERAEDTEWLCETLKMAKITGKERQSILDLQIVTPIQDWSAERSVKDSKGKGRARNEGVGRICTNHQLGSPSSTASGDSVPSIEVTSPNTTDVCSKGNVPWLSHKQPSYVR